MVLIRCAPLLLVASGCIFDQPDPMEHQARGEAFEENAFFDDGRAMRVPPEHSIPWSRAQLPANVRWGVVDGGTWSRRIPVPVTAELVQRGRARFEVLCATCHGLLGDGDSPVAHKMTLRRPPSLLVHRPHATGDGGTAEEALDGGPGRHPHFYPGHVFEVVSHGFGLMPSYAAELPVEDRWAVIAYLEALRLSQRAQYSALPPDLQRKLMEAAP